MSLLRASLAIALCLVIGAASAAELRADCPHPGSPLFYFQASALNAKRSDLDEFVRDWYSKHLRTMEEPSLTCCTSRAAETYRFLWLRSFHHPVAVRVDFSSNEARLSATELSGAGGYEPGAVLKRTRRMLRASEAARLRASLEQGAFWTLPTDDPGPGMFDGSQWIVEGRRGAQHHLVDRWTPKGGAVKELGLLFLELARFRTDGPAIY